MAALGNSYRREAVGSMLASQPLLGASNYWKSWDCPPVHNISLILGSLAKVRKGEEFIPLSNLCWVKSLPQSINSCTLLGVSMQIKPGDILCFDVSTLTWKWEPEVHYRNEARRYKAALWKGCQNHAGWLKACRLDRRRGCFDDLRIIFERCPDTQPPLSSHSVEQGAMGNRLLGNPK